MVWKSIGLYTIYRICTIISIHHQVLLLCAFLIEEYS